MQQNVGGYDRLVRLVVGALLILVGVAGYAGAIAVGAALSIVILLVGVILAGTGLARTCLFYRLVGFSTADADTTTSEETQETTANRPS